MNEALPRKHARRHLLSWLSDVCYDTREDALLSREAIAARGGVSYHLIYRFEEYADRWPRELDALVGAYAGAVDIDPRLIWLRTIERWMQCHKPVTADAEPTLNEVPPDALRAVEQAIDAYARGNEPGQSHTG